MSLKEHLYELRYRLGLAMLVIVVGAILGFVWFQVRIGPIPSLGDILTGPYCQPDLAPYRADITKDGRCALLQTKPFEIFLVQLQVGTAAGAVLLSPLWLYQIWAFITPGLYAKERKFARIFVGIGGLLFVAGAVLAYLVVPEGLKVLLGFGSGNWTTALTGSEYISFVITMLFIFGVSFLLPLVVVMLNRAGVVSYARLAKWRRGLVMGLFVFAAIATPGTDPISMVVLAIALVLLFEMAIQVARVNDKRKAKLRAAEGWDALDDNEAAPFDYVASDADGNMPGEKAVASEPAKRVNYDDAT
ncbi:sec-independent protein translocase protein TatC [Lentzea fradiae]|uniref:Sec-independent protein translocase protein TatC n=1 Tax=Lentzea fradiae TaxID=200378 RepID=A0A1G7K7R9_9PSEU|nr:twin-arginine translocase subunit TatC [Lentzea fradiae]SDF33061.1 sec-independent protein translocase protein TatC [Lentzea fradiae]